MPAARLVVACVAFVLLVLCGSVAAAPSPAAVDVVSGLASMSPGGSVTFAGEGFTPRTWVQVSVEGSTRSLVLSTARGAFATSLRLSEVSRVSIAAAGQRPGGRVHVVIATIQIGVPLVPVGSDGSTSDRQLYGALGLGLGAVVLGVLTLLALRFRRGRPPGPLR